MASTRRVRYTCFIDKIVISILFVSENRFLDDLINMRMYLSMNLWIILITLLCS